MVYRLFEQWAAANCTVPLSVIANQYCILNCKPLLVTVSLHVAVYKCRDL